MNVDKNARPLILLLLYLALLQGTASAQTESTSSRISAPNSIYGELIAGYGLGLTANYERILVTITPLSFSVHAGFGIVVSEPVVGIALPAGVNLLIGRNHMLELSTGMVYVSGEDWDSSPHSNVWLSALIGYRYQPINGGLIIRIGFTAYFTDEVIHPSIGFSLGHAF
jgi:hypothetical protein